MNDMMDRREAEPRHKTYLQVPLQSCDILTTHLDIIQSHLKQKTKEVGDEGFLQPVWFSMIQSYSYSVHKYKLQKTDFCGDTGIYEPPI